MEKPNYSLAELLEIQRRIEEMKALEEVSKRDLEEARKGGK